MGSDYTPTTWAVALLGRVKIPATKANVKAVVGWENAEGGHFNNSARYNPLNTTQSAPGATNTGTQGNIKAYTSWNQGLDATARTLQNGRYGSILAALHGPDPGKVADAIGRSPWGTNGALVRQTILGAHAPSTLPAPPASKASSPSPGGGGLFDAGQQHGMLYALLFVATLLTGAVLVGVGVNHAAGGAPARAAAPVVKKAAAAAVVA
jgi:hypothetical protein